MSDFNYINKNVLLKEVTSAKAGEGIIIKATAGTKYDLALATASDNGMNMLVGVTADTAIIIMYTKSVSCATSKFNQ